MKTKLIALVLICLNITIFYGQGLEQSLNGKIDIIVAKDGSGNFTTLQAAIESVAKSQSKRTVIFVRNGTYREKFEIESGRNKVTIVGESLDSTILVYNDYSGSGLPYQGIMTSRNGDPVGTSTSHTMYVDSEDFTLMNMTVINDAGPVGQAVAINLGGDRTILVHCRILGNQDTFYTWGYGRFLIKDCFIEGNVDFIFGRGVALFDSCIINSNRSSCQITAASTDADWKYGYVFQNCRVMANPGINSVTLGRPWKANCQTVFMNSFLDSHIKSTGWSEWGGNTNHTTCYYAEYNNYGTGFVPDSRVSWSHQLTEQEAAIYTMPLMFAKDVKSGGTFSSDWLPNIHNDELYKIIKSETPLIYDDTLRNNTELKTIKIFGEEIPEFSSTKKSYTVDIIDTATVIPEIIVETVADKSTYTIEYADDLSGRNNIKVTSLGGYTTTYYIRFDLITSINNESIRLKGADVLNNPFIDQLMIKTNNLVGDEPLKVSLYTLTGQVVSSSVFENIINDAIYTFQTGDIASGLYICKIQQGNKSIQRKVLKK